MTKNRVLQYISSLGLTLCFILSFVSVGWSQNPLAPNWNLDNLGSQIRVLDHDYNGLGYLIGGGALYGNASENSLTIDGANIGTGMSDANFQTLWLNGADFVAGGAVYDRAALNNTLTVQNGSVVLGRTLIGGAALLDDLDHRLSSGTANYNTVNVKNTTVRTYDTSAWSIVPRPFLEQIGGDVIGGYTGYGFGHADFNTVNITDSSDVQGNVYGGAATTVWVNDTDYDEEGKRVNFPGFTTNYNTVNVVDSTVRGKIYGGFGGWNVSGNTVHVDHSTVEGSIVGGTSLVTVYSQGGGAVASITGNSIIVENGSSVASAVTAMGNSFNAIGNSLSVDNSQVGGGSLHTAMVSLMLDESGNPINAAVGANELRLSNITSALHTIEIGAGLNMAGISNSNRVVLDGLDDLTVDLTNYNFGGAIQVAYFNQSALNLFTAPTVFVSAGFDYDTLFPNEWGLNLIPASIEYNRYEGANHGFVYAGAAFDYTSQVNDINLVPTPDSTGSLPAWATTVPEELIVANGGTNADGNTIHIANSNVKANVFGGIAGEIKEINYATWATEDVEGSGTHLIKTHVYKQGPAVITTVYDCGTSGTSCTLLPDRGKTEYPAALDDIYSASNNTVILEDSHYDGTLYAGYVVGADLKSGNVVTQNNTVILRGNATLSNDAVLYGGNSSFGRVSNRLVFDRVVGPSGAFVTYNNRNQFRNFNKTWLINADWNTRINFNFNNVNALVAMDSSAMGQENLTGEVIVKAQTAADLTLQQNGELTDIIDNSVELAQKRVGIFTYDLTPEVIDSSTIGWRMTSRKDSHNIENYGQLPIVGLALVSEGPDMLSAAFQDAWTADAESNTFINSGYHKTRYETGSGFDLNSALVQAGWWKKLAPDFMMGLFAKYVHGSYETYPIDTDGSANAFGGGLMVSYHYSDTGRLEGDVEVGYMKADFNSPGLGGDTLRTKGMYYGFMGGIVEQPLQNWEIFARLNAFRKQGDSLTSSLEQPVKYEAMQSLTLRAGTEVAFEDLMFSGLVPSLGASVLYEFDGTSKVKVAGEDNNDASLKGLSGRGQVGLKYQNEELPLPILSQLVVYGQVGKRRGFGGEINISFQF